MALASHPSAAYSAGGPRQAAVTGWGRAGPGEPLDTRPTLTRTVTSSEIARDFYVRHSEHHGEKTDFGASGPAVAQGESIPGLKIVRCDIVQ